MITQYISPACLIIFFPNLFWTLGSSPNLITQQYIQAEKRYDRRENLARNIKFAEILSNAKKKNIRLRGGEEQSQPCLSKANLTNSTLTIPTDFRCIAEGMASRSSNLRKICILRGYHDADRKIFVRQPEILEVVGEWSDEEEEEEEAEQTIDELHRAVRHTQACASPAAVAATCAHSLKPAHSRKPAPFPRGPAARVVPSAAAVPVQVMGPWRLEEGSQGELRRLHLCDPKKRRPAPARRPAVPASPPPPPPPPLH